MVRVRELAGIASFVFIAMGVAMAIQAAHIHWPASLAQSQATASLTAPASNFVIPHGTIDPPKLVLIPLRVKPVQPPELTIVPDGALAPPATPGEQSGAVAARIRETVPSALFAYFDVYLYVSKASAGAWAQHMFIFHKDDAGDLVFEQSVPVSTGRERNEKYFTSTPTGLFELDSNRFDRVHFSHVWHGAPMPWAMFLNYTIHGHQAGIALHSWAGHEVALGQRASGGCVRLPPEEAQYLFERFQREEGGYVPVFTLDPVSNTTNVDGDMLLDAGGTPELAPGYRVLVIIQDYPGGPALVASIS